METKIKKILIFSRDPGGANTVIPLVEPLCGAGYEVLLYGKDIALAKYRDNGLSAKNILDEFFNISIETVKEFLIKEKPDLIITGTSADDYTEKYLWKIAEQLNIPSFAILDQWINYGLRFSPYGVAELEKFNQNRHLEYLPTKILVMDEMAKREAIEDGISEARLAVTGQPYFETLLKNASSIRDKSPLRRKYSIPDNEKVLLFVSEPICDTYKETDKSSYYWGYTERTIFAEVLEALEIISNELLKPPTIIVRRHNKEKDGNFNDIIQTYNKHCRIIFDEGSEVIDLINTSNIVVGMSSMLLIEAAVLGKEVFSVQIGLNRKDPFVLNRLGVTQVIGDKEILKQVFLKALKLDNNNKIEFNFIKNPVENIINEVKKVI